MVGMETATLAVTGGWRLRQTTHWYSPTLFNCHGSTSVTVQVSLLSRDTAENVEWLNYCCYLNSLWLKGKYSCGKWKFALYWMLPWGFRGVFMSNLQERSKADRSKQQHHSSELELLMPILMTSLNHTQYVGNGFIQSSLEPAPKSSVLGIWIGLQNCCPTVTAELPQHRFKLFSKWVSPIILWIS